MTRYNLEANGCNPMIISDPEGSLVLYKDVKDHLEWKPFETGTTLQGLASDYAFRVFEGKEYYLRLPGFKGKGK